jgi:hypothetical protein
MLGLRGGAVADVTRRTGDKWLSLKPMQHRQARHLDDPTYRFEQRVSTVAATIPGC